jgi:DNA polymerase (family 10)
VQHARTENSTSRRVLADLEVVVASVHSGFKQSAGDTNFMRDAERALDIIGHTTEDPSSRSYRIDFAVFEAAAGSGPHEINAFPQLTSGSQARSAREHGSLSRSFPMTKPGRLRR